MRVKWRHFETGHNEVNYRPMTIKIIQEVMKQGLTNTETEN